MNLREAQRETRKRIAELMRKGLKHKDICERLGCHKDTVATVSRMLREGREP